MRLKIAVSVVRFRPWAPPALRLIERATSVLGFCQNLQEAGEPAFATGSRQ
jgi:hypothetical protein